LRVIQDSGRHMLGTIDDVLDFARLEADALSLASTDVDIRRVVAATLSMFAPIAQKQELQLIGWTDPDVPDTITGDGGRLRQVLTNLIGNAVKFTRRGMIDVHVRREDRVLYLSVKDTGIGIPRAKQEKIFDPYEQVEPGTRQMGGGQGLGLAISRRLVRRMGGELQCESEINVGSTFTFHVPLADVDLVRVPKQHLRGLMVAVCGCGAPSSVIVAEALRQHGAQATIVTTGDDDKPVEATALIGSVVIIAATSMGHDAAIVSAKQQNPKLRAIAINRLGDATPTWADAELDYPVSQRDVVRTVSRITKERTPTGSYVIPLSVGVFAVDHPLRILVADDDPVSLRVALGMLKREGYAADPAVGGAAAIAAAETGQYEVIFMDMRMPDVDGVDATRAIRASEAIEKQPYIIAFTADAVVKAQRAFHDAGVDAILTKPARLRDIRDTLSVAYTSLHRRQ
ncbi:ATP-binding protein, partial [Microbacterium sp.]